MNIHIYCKTHDDLSELGPIIEQIQKEEDSLFLTIEDRRSFHRLESLKKELQDAVVIITSLSALGFNNSDVAGQLAWFSKNETVLVISEISSTYEYGIGQPMNRAVLQTLIQTLSHQDTASISTFHKKNSGRSRLPFPKGWDEMYDQWMKGKLSSKEFLQRSGLKKATFYNMISEQKRIDAANEAFMLRYQTS